MIVVWAMCFESAHATILMNEEHGNTESMVRSNVDLKE